MSSPEMRSTAEMYGVVTRQAAQRSRDRERRRRRIASLAVVGLFVVVGGGAILLRSGEGRGRVSSGPGPIGPQTTLDREPLTAEERWAPMGAASLSPRSVAVSAWTGEELLVWAGRSETTDAGPWGDTRTDGSLYDPATDTWEPMAESPLPLSNSPFEMESYASAWTGRELLIWGGKGPDAAAYDPAANTWRSIDPGPLDARVQFAYAWTGTELAIYGGSDAKEVLETEPDPELVELDTGAIYDPTTDAWRRIPASGTRQSRQQAVWDGKQIVVLPGYTPDGTEIVTLGLDPATLTWTRLAPGPLTGLTAPPVWTGSHIAAVGMTGYQAEDIESKAAIYDPAADTWTELALPGGIDTAQLVIPSMLWTGTEVVLLGSPFLEGTGGESLLGAALDPAAKSWRRLPPSGLSARSGMSTVWTGTELLTWGGAGETGFTGAPLADGARYTPGPGR